jgi:uncharacterized membrane protein YphA (DoxX/SURF4 family)
MSMTLSRRVAHPLLASIFVVGGLDAVRNPTGKTENAEVVTAPLSERAGVIPLDPETLVRVNGAVQIGAGLLLATGRFSRLASLALIGSIIPTTLAGHRFWGETNPATRAQQRVHFLKNLGLLGGLILAAVDTEGAPSLGWRAKRRTSQMETAMILKREAIHAMASGTKGGAKTSALNASNASRRTFRRGNAEALRVGRRLGAAGIDSAQRMATASAAAAALAATTGHEGIQHAHKAISDAVQEPSGAAAHVVQQATSMANNAIRQLEPLTQRATHAGVDAIRSSP